MVWFEVSTNIAPPAMMKKLLDRESGKYMDKLGREVVKIVRGNIIKQRSIITGGRFPKVSDEWQARKLGKKLRYPYRALYFSGMMYRAIHYFKSREHAGEVGIKNIGNPLRRNVAEWQQSGAYGGPARVFFGLSNRAIMRIRKTILGPWARSIRQKLENVRTFRKLR